MRTQNFAVIREEIKRVLKARKVRYGKLAKDLGLSESGIKKMLNGNDLSYNKICSILDAAGVGISDFFKILDERAPTEKTLNPAQEEYFLKNPNAYYFFYQLLGADLDWKKLKQRHQLTQKSVESYLYALDKIGAIELHPGNIVKSEFAGSHRLSFGPALTKKVVDQKHRSILDFAHIPNEKFRGRKYVVNGSLNLKPATAAEFAGSVKNLINDYMTRAEREDVIEPSRSLEEIGFLCVVTPTEGMPHEKIPNL